MTSSSTAGPFKPHGPAATQRLKQLLSVGQVVTLRVADTDRYGRTVAKIYKGSLSITTGSGV